ncbi:hypothetical protein ACP6JD_003002 [Aspergillus fumigatus]
MEPEDLTDPDLRAAIAASLRDLHDNGASPADDSQHKVVDLTAESDDDEVIPIFPKSKSVIGSDTDADEDEDLKRAIALSLQDSEDTEKTSPYQSYGNKQYGPPPEMEGSATDHKPSQPLGLLGLNRKQMEEERLARIAKRKADDVGSIDHRQAKYSKNESNQPAGRRSSGSVSREYAPSIGAPRTRHETVESTPRLPNPSPTTGVQFPKGVVKKTYAQYCPRTGDDITIEEVFQRSRHQKRQYEAETASMSNLRLCFPPMEGQVNCMHSKLMLLFHPGYLRIVAPTANLTPYDWGEMGGVMENVATTSVGSKTVFEEELVYFLRASTLQENIISRLDEFDFSPTSHIMLVHTM